MTASSKQGHFSPALDTRISRHDQTLRAFLRFFLHHMETRGIPQSLLRRRLRLAEDWLEGSSRAQLLETIPRLLRAAQRTSEDPRLGLHVGESFHFCLAGLGGLVATHAPTPRLALETFGHFVGEAGVLRVRATRSSESLGLAPEVLPAWPRAIRALVIDGYLAATVAALRAVSGPTFAPRAIHLARPRSDAAREYERLLGCRVTFDSPADVLVLRAADLDAPSRLYEPRLYEQLRFTADLTLDAPSGASPMRQLVEQAIRAGDHVVETVSKTLQVNVRTLQRRLQSEGTSFRSILNEVRARMAEDLLGETELPLAEIAARLGYADDKSLRKAIRHVTGRTPSELRRAARQPD